MRLPHPHPLQAPNALESLASLLMRTKRDNYYEEANWLESLLPLPVPQNLNLLERSDQFARLSELTELSVDMLWRCTLHSLAQRYILPSQVPWEGTYSHPEGRPTWENSRLAMYVHGHLTSKLCPLCWRENRSILLPWSLRHVTTCARHQVLLVDHCAQCGSNLQANWEKGVCRACQISLADLPAISLSGHHASTAVTAVIWSALGCSDESFAPFPLHLPPDHLVQTISPPALLEFFWYVGQLLLARDSDWPLFATDLLLSGTAWSRPPTILRQASVAEVHGVLTALWHLLDGWPATWEMTLERLVEIEGPFATDTPQRFPHLLTTQFSAPEFAWLYRGWEDFMWKHRSSKACLYPWLRHWRRTQQLQEAHLGPSLLSRREAAQRLHRSERTLKQLLELERLQSSPVPATESETTKRHWRLIKAESVVQVQQSLEEELTLAQAATICGVSRGSVLQLVKAGLLPALRSPAMKQGPVWVFSKAALHEALAHLIGHLPVRSAPALEDHNSLSLRSAMRVVSAVAITLPQLLQIQQAGHLVGFRLSNDLTLATLRIERVHLEAFMVERQGGERGDMLALDAVRRILHCSAMTLQRWRASKLLVPSQENTVGTKRRRWYCRQDVLTFVDRYITVHEASALLECTKLTLQSWAREGVVPAVSGPHLDGVHGYRFDKAVLEQWRQQRMTSREAAEWLGISKPTLHRWVNQGKLTPLGAGKGKHRWFAREEIVHYNQSSSRSTSVPAGNSAVAQ